MAKKVDNSKDSMEDLTTAWDNLSEITPEINKEPQFKPSELNEKTYQRDSLKEIKSTTDDFINPLRPDRVIVRMVPRNHLKISDKKHPVYGGMAESSKRTYTVPLGASGGVVPVLTSDEQKFLEHYMGFEEGSLSPHRRVNNYWISTVGRNGSTNINTVTLVKGDNILDLSSPADYIKYKILLANKDFIAPSIKELQARPKSTYQYVIVEEAEEVSLSTNTLNSTVESYKEFGKMEYDYSKMKYIIEVVDGRAVAETTKIEFLRVKIGDLIRSKPVHFLSVAKDPYLDTKILIKKAISSGVITFRGDYLYLTEGNVPLCNRGQEPTLNNAAAYLNDPTNQELLYTIQVKLTK